MKSGGLLAIVVLAIVSIARVAVARKRSLELSPSVTSKRTLASLKLNG
jgi:hypothetical protein